ncbi:unnamed protein product [Phytomonas sp. Hart1]|nr:unnamed protein product [Phytomonas sp. Hart1]|eukprot:CCW69793.1 unnamed protein product [Phytomonas sp. isolate Hart1]
MSASPLNDDNSIEFSEILPENSLIHTKLKDIHLLLCKPKILPVKSYSLEKLEMLEKKLSEESKQRRQLMHEQKEASAWKSDESPPIPKTTSDAPIIPPPQK